MQALQAREVGAQDDLRGFDELFMEARDIDLLRDLDTQRLQQARDFELVGELLFMSFELGERGRERIRRALALDREAHLPRDAQRDRQVLGRELEGLAKIRHELPDHLLLDDERNERRGMDLLAEHRRLERRIDRRGRDIRNRDRDRALLVRGPGRVAGDRHAVLGR
jgi:hypothetical protein